MENSKKNIFQSEIFWLVLAVTAVLVKRLLLSPYGINREAAIEMEAIFLALDGKVIYRDFFWYHGFLPIYWHALVFKLFNPEMYYLRFFVTCFAGIACAFAYKIARYFLQPPLACIAAILGFTGLIIPEHVTGTMPAICFFIIFIFYLLKYCDSSEPKHMFFAGIFGGLVSGFQVLPLGLLVLMAGVFSSFGFFIFAQRPFLTNLKMFLFGFAVFPTFLYGTLAIWVPLNDLFRNLFPIFFGYEKVTSGIHKFPIPSLLPSFDFSGGLPGIVANLNRYLIIDFRWWLIIIVFLVGLWIFFQDWKQDKFPKKNILIFGVLVLFGPLMQTKFLLYNGRLGLTPNYINMLPTFVLLFTLICRFGRRQWATGLGIIFLFIYFFYPATKYYFYFSTNAIPLGMPYSTNIKVSPYKEELYRKTVETIQSESQSSDKIVFAGLNRYYSIFSGRHDVFRDNILAFTRTSFYAPQVGISLNAIEYENEIIQKIEDEKPKLILFPESLVKNAPKGDWPFISFIENQWINTTQFGDIQKINPYEYESPVLIYSPK
jgi:hypothetical protein